MNKRGPYKTAHVTADMKAYQRQYYLARKAARICTGCGAQNPGEHVQCDRCKARNAKKRATAGKKTCKRFRNPVKPRQQ